ncbi:glycosyltransferase family 2 protein [Halomonas sp. PR-M31]|uniref:glycosyltransferase family 2 protein n=1 Tax=Halomonas sp. PR-M31 TaxID=1471202 RepID=UPI000A4A81D5|nr:glycosyltransferase family 2 protein [Halomonas sp. PR-M31]
MPKIVAVILTYNRKDLLERCLKAVYSQTYSCNSILVIDNASKDETEKFLTETKYPNLKVYVLSHNIGASGGFNAGFRLAYENGADFIWIMDDDVIPEPNALQNLLDAEKKLNIKKVNYSYLLSSAFTENGYVTNTPGLSSKKNNIGYLEWPEMIEFGMVPIWRATFVSILLPRATLTEHGLPIASMFIWGEDSEYTLRVTRNSPGFLVGNSKVLHLRQEDGPISILSEKNLGRMKYHKYFMRNKIFISRKYSLHHRQLISDIYSVVRLFFKLLIRKEISKATIVLRGLIGGIFFSPQTELADASIDNLGVSIRSFETNTEKKEISNQNSMQHKCVELIGNGNQN